MRHFEAFTSECGHGRLCCGHAGLTATLTDKGFKGIGIDWHGNKHESVVPILKLDLTTEHGQALVWRILEQGRVKFIHCAPPCGTYSKARGRKLPEWAKKANAPDPQPLRSNEWPEGVPWFRDDVWKRVETANKLTDFLAEVSTYCRDKRITFTLENPASSYIWKMPSMARLAALRGVRRYEHNACMYGGKRDKHTCILSNSPLCSALTRMCDGSHEHAPWGIRWHKGWSFATAEECDTGRHGRHAVRAASASDTSGSDESPLSEARLFCESTA